MGGERLSAAEYRAQVAATPPTMGRAPGKKQFALGRLPKGTMNKTERRYLDEVIMPSVAAGGIQWWAFEAVKLMLAKNTSLTVDFAIMRVDCSLGLIDVKGSPAMIEDDAWAKLKIAARLFPFRFHIAWPDREVSDGWVITEIEP